MRKLTMILVVLSASAWTAQSQAGMCDDRKKALPKIAQHCTNLNQNISLEGNPFVYTNPDAGCDLGLSLPGLPSFGDIGFGLDSCKILRAVTGDLVKEINSGFQQAVDDSLGDVADEYNDIDIDPQDYIEDQIN